MAACRSSRGTFAFLTVVLASMILLLVSLILRSPQIRAQEDECDAWRWAVYCDCQPHGSCEVKLNMLSASGLKKADRTIISSGRTEEEALKAACAQLENVKWVTVGLYPGFQGDLAGKHYNVDAIIIRNYDDPAQSPCREPQPDEDKDGVPDDRDCSPSTPPNTPVDRSGKPCKAVEPDCRQWCQDAFDRRGLPEKRLLLDASSGEPPDCECWCEDADGGLSSYCLARDCVQVCRDAFGPRATWDGYDAQHCDNCICQAGWLMKDDRCVPCEDICTHNDDRARHDQADSIEERCACTCDRREGLTFDYGAMACGCMSHTHPAGKICVCDENWEPRLQGGCQECPPHAQSSGHNNDPCEPKEGFRWEDDTEQACVREPRNVNVISITASLRTKRFTITKVTTYDPSTLPPGTVVFWDRAATLKDGLQRQDPRAHVSIVINKVGDQMEMGADRAQVFTPSEEPKPRQPDHIASATYTPGEIWLPPDGTRVRPSIRSELDALSRGRHPKTSPSDTGGSDWNCFGFVEVVVEHFAVQPDPGGALPDAVKSKNATVRPLKDPPGIPFAVELEAGALYGRGLEFDVFVPDGFVAFTHEFMVDVGEGGATRIYAFSGQTSYYPEGEGPVIQVPPGQMVTISGGEVSMPVAFDAASLAPWWEDDVSPGDDIDAISSLAVPLAAGCGCCCLAVLAPALFAAWWTVRRRRSAAAVPPASPPESIRLPRERADRGPRPPEAPAPWGALVATEAASSPGTVPLDQPVVTIGRSAASDLVLKDKLVSRRHLQIRRQGEAVFVEDLGSWNGTYVNGIRISGSQPLSAGDVIRIGSTEFVYRRGPGQPEPPATRQRPGQATGETTRIARPPDGATVTMGRGSGNDVVLPDPSVSRRHARLRREKGITYIEDLDSANGTYVNGVRITGSRQLRSGDVIRLGNTELTV